MTVRTKEEIMSDIRTVIDQYLAPGVGQHGGEIVLLDYDINSHTVKLQMSGACSGCAGSKQTLSNAVEKMIKYYVKEVQHIEAEDDPNSTVDPYFAHPIDYPSANEMLDELTQLSNFVKEKDNNK